MLPIDILLSIIFLILIYFIIGKSILNIFKLRYSGFELILGFIAVLSLFHILSVIPTILNYKISYVYNIVYPVVILTGILISILALHKRIIIKKPNLFLLISTIILVSIYFLFDFIIPGDSSFYLSLIRSVVTSESIYTLEPWSGTTTESIGYMYYFVTYEVFIGSLSNLFRMDPTIFTANVIPATHLVIIIYSTYAFLKYIFRSEQKTRYAFLLYLFVFVFLNSGFHRVFFTHNAFNLVTNVYTGKTIYFHAIVLFEFILMDRIVKVRDRKDIWILAILNLITPGLTASALYLQLMITTSLFIYLAVFKPSEPDRFYGKYILKTFIPIMINYCFLLFAKSFIIQGNLFKAIVLGIFAVIIVWGIVMMISGKKFIKENPRFIKRLFYGGLIVVGVVSIGAGIYTLLTRQSDIENGTSLLPNIPEMIYLYGYNLVLFYILAVISFIFYRKHNTIFTRFSLHYYIIIMLITFVNPINIPIVGGLISSFHTYHRILFILPLHFLIVYYLVHLRNKKVFALWIILIMVPGITIFHGIERIDQNTDFFYKVDKDTLDIGKKIEQLDEKPTIIAEEEFINEIPMVTTNYHFIITVNNFRQIDYNVYPHQDREDLFNMVNDTKEIDTDYFETLLKIYQIDLIIIGEDNDLIEYLNEKHELRQDLSSENAIVFEVIPKDK
ncbi:DUF6077 domain-containing protein [Haloplasma contractile]|uniref:Uncharacterized protein n=1 Tax=Haloplasma contractile SSD-17B TaxID=1033810 RepID=U2FDK0_9MOLU|nr:DUF6077 domain-containing protein [Haloplasma contractile]ERJ11050.1 hypothetical protein HLPCO_002871 [Haloplasma contractile SSD-17B]